MAKVASVSGVLTIGNIAYDGYGYDIHKWDNYWNKKDSHFVMTDSVNISSLQTIGSWANSLNIIYNGMLDLNMYPKYCKFYVGGELMYIGDRFCRCTSGWISYTRYPKSDKYADYFLNKNNLYTQCNITLEFYDKLVD